MKQTRLKRAMRLFSIGELSKASGIKRAYLSHLIHGRRVNPSKRKARRLADVLSVRPEWLFPNVYER